MICRGRGMTRARRRPRHVRVRRSVNVTHGNARAVRLASCLAMRCFAELRAEVPRQVKAPGPDSRPEIKHLCYARSVKVRNARFLLLSRQSAC